MMENEVDVAQNQRALIPLPIDPDQEGENLPSCFLTTRNFHTFKWYDLRLLIIQDVLHQILPQLLQVTAKTIHTIEFMGGNLFSNIQLLLSHCPNLVCLIFTNILVQGYPDSDPSQIFKSKQASSSTSSSSPSSSALDNNGHCSISNHHSDINSSVEDSSKNGESPTNPNPNSIIKLSQLVRLTFNGMGELSLDEIRILHFLTTAVEHHSLKTLSFEPKQNRNPNANGNGNGIASLIHANSSLSSSFISSLNASGPKSVFDWRSVLTKFLAGNSRIKILVAERPLLSLSLSSVDEITRRGIENIQLQELTCNVGSLGSGFELLLKSQRELQVLNCYSSPRPNPNPQQNQNQNQNVQLMRMSYYETILDTVKGCSESLKTIRIAHKIVFSEEDESLGNVPEFLFHDCSVYKECVNLAHLSLSLSISNDLAQRRMKPGAILNPQFFPVSLKTLIIRFDVMPEDQMRLFIQRLPSLQNLSLFLLYGNSDSPFKIQLPLLQILVELPKIQIFEISSCSFQDWDGIQNFISGSPELVNRLEVTPESCTFWKNR